MRRGEMAGKRAEGLRVSESLEAPRGKKTAKSERSTRSHLKDPYPKPSALALDCGPFKSHAGGCWGLVHRFSAAIAFLWSEVNAQANRDDIAAGTGSNTPLPSTLGLSVAYTANILPLSPG